MRSVPTSSVLINIARALADDEGLKNLSIKTFGRGCQVVVGGYAQKLASDNDAPFVWVFSEEDDTEVSGSEAIGFTAKLVVGICPQRDIPSVDVMFADADDVMAKANGVHDALKEILGVLEVDTEIYEAVKVHVDEAEARVEDCAGELASAREASAGGDYTAMLEGVAAVGSKSAPLASDVEAVSGLVSGVPEAAELVEAAAEAVSALGEANAVLSAEREKVAVEFANYVDDPFVSEIVRQRDVENNGLMIYGAVRTVELFKARIIDVLNRGSFGMPLKSVKFKNQAVTHYPLDWSELTAEFENPETLSL